MKPLLFFSSARLAAGFLIGCFAAQSVLAATVHDFGYARMRTPSGGRVNTNTVRPLLVILADFGNVGMANPPFYYESLVFNQFGLNPQSIIGWFSENSNDRFSYSQATNVTILQFSTNESHASITNSDLYFSNVVRRAMLSNLVNFAAFDRNSDMTNSDDELEIVLISNDHPNGEALGGHRAFGSPKVNGWTLAGSLSEVGDNFDFYTIAHENCHGLDAIDLYGSDVHYSYCAKNISMMRCRTGDQDTFHLDPWHKLQLGWAEPRIVNMRTGGAFQLPAAQLRRSDAAVLLYDSQRGLDEFFMLEYRTTNTTSFGVGYDRSVASTGLAIWHIKQDINKAPVLVPPFWMGINGQIGWEECASCHALFFRLDLESSDCPATGARHTLGTPSYLSIISDTADPGQPEWRACAKCRGLFYGPNQAISHCPGGGMHDGSLSRNYRVRTSAIYTNSPTPPGPEVDQFRRCTKCQVMFRGKNQSESICPEDSMQHLAHLAINYRFPTYEQGVFTLAAPNLKRGGTDFWPSNTMTSQLLWEDGTPSTVRIRVQPFEPSSDEITIDAITEGETWVDFNYTGTTESGFFATPYKTMGRGVTNSPWGGTVKFKPGTKNEQAIVDKRLFLEAPSGGAIIGQ